MTTIDLNDGVLIFDAKDSILGFELWDADDDFHGIGGLVPHWFLVALSATFAAVPWLVDRFSLRALLIAITLVAVALGLAVRIVK